MNCFTQNLKLLVACVFILHSELVVGQIENQIESTKLDGSTSFGVKRVPSTLTKSNSEANSLGIELKDDQANLDNMVTFVYTVRHPNIVDIRRFRFTEVRKSQVIKNYEFDSSTNQLTLMYDKTRIRLNEIIEKLKLYNIDIIENSK